jgi:hypothetical protein
MSTGHSVAEGEDTMQRSGLRSIFAVGAVAVGALLAPIAPVAHAQPIGERTIKSECQSAGGYYQTWSDTAGLYSMCTYRDMSGEIYHDVYLNGEFLRTS